MSHYLYLDYNCFQRNFDDYRQLRIRMEAVACEAIFGKAEAGVLDLAWSFIHEDENHECPYREICEQVKELSKLCKVKIAPNETIRKKASDIVLKYRLGAKDALHLACALYSHADMFITCDDEIKKKTGGKLDKMLVINPAEYIIS